MATRARVALQLKEDKIIGSYQHWDGYPSGLGYNLIDNWYKADKVEKAIMLGDASKWGQFIGEKLALIIEKQIHMIIRMFIMAVIEARKIVIIKSIPAKKPI